MKASIIIPVYNASALLGRCLDSVRRQTFADYEVIAVDDGSTDDSGRLLDEYANDPRIRVVHQPNRGQGAARNAALRLAQGEYVLMVDADDFIHPRLLEFAVGAAEAGRFDFVAFDYCGAAPEETGGIAAEWAADKTVPKVEPLSSCAFDWFVGARRTPTPWQILYRRATLSGRFFPEGVVYEDVPFTLLYLYASYRGAHLDRPLYCYVSTKSSITHKTPLAQRIVGYETGMRMLKEGLDPRRYRQLARVEFTLWIRDLSRRAKAVSEPSERAAARAEVSDFVRRLLREKLMTWGDFRLFWRFRILLSTLWGRRC